MPAPSWSRWGSQARYQQMLDAAHGELSQHTPAPVRMTLDADGSGNYSLQLSESAAAQ